MAVLARPHGPSTCDRPDRVGSVDMGAMPAPAVTPPSKNGSEHAIVIQNLRKQFGADERLVVALDDVSLDIGRGEFVAVVGPSGCGKSTLLALIAGLQRPTSGRVRIEGREVVGPYTDVGIVFQNHVLLDWLTTLENILFQADMRRLPRREYLSRAHELIGMVSLTGFEKSYPYQLSGGMKQRTSICRALLHDPPLLLMDEPFGALDALTRDQLCIDLEKIWLGSGKTVLFITHSVQEAVQLADRVLVMTPRPGRIFHEVAVDLPRPRYQHGTEAGLNDYVAEIKAKFVEQGILRT
jgi:NitT/TauT family transport system ATP-binding protein